MQRSVIEIKQPQMFTRYPLLKLNMLNDKIYYKDVNSSLGDEYETNEYT